MNIEQKYSEQRKANARREKDRGKFIGKLISNIFQKTIALRQYILKLYSQIFMDVYTVVYEELSGKIATEYVKEMGENKQRGCY